MPVGECRPEIFWYKLMNHGKQIIGAFGISDRIPCGMGSKISEAGPESWREGIPTQMCLKLLKDMPGVKIVEQNIQVDHIHTIMIIPPKYSVSEVIGRIKCKSASRLRKKFTWLENVYWKENIVWSPGYFVSTVGLNEQSIIKYVRWQEAQDSGQAKLDL